jgi:hypothetical protein
MRSQGLLTNHWAASTTASSSGLPPNPSLESRYNPLNIRRAVLQATTLVATASSTRLWGVAPLILRSLRSHPTTSVLRQAQCIHTILGTLYQHHNGRVVHLIRKCTATTPNRVYRRPIQPRYHPIMLHSQATATPTQPATHNSPIMHKPRIPQRVLRPKSGVSGPTCSCSRSRNRLANQVST